MVVANQSSAHFCDQGFVSCLLEAQLEAETNSCQAGKSDLPICCSPHSNEVTRINMVIFLLSMEGRWQVVES